MVNKDVYINHRTTFNAVATAWLLYGYLCVWQLLAVQVAWHKILSREAEMIAGDVTCRRSYCRVF